MKDDITTEDADLKVFRQRRETRRIANTKAPRRIGKQKFEEEDIELNMPTEIAGNLRNLKPEGSILITAFKSTCSML